MQWLLGIDECEMFCDTTGDLRACMTRASKVWRVGVGDNSVYRNVSFVFKYERTSCHTCWMILKQGLLQKFKKYGARICQQKAT